VDTSGYPSVFISHYNGQELSLLDHCLLWITLATTLVYPSHSRQWSNYNISGSAVDVVVEMAQTAIINRQRANNDCSRQFLGGRTSVACFTIRSRITLYIHGYMYIQGRPPSP